MSKCHVEELALLVADFTKEFPPGKDFCLKGAISRVLQVTQIEQDELTAFRFVLLYNDDIQESYQRNLEKGKPNIEPPLSPHIVYLKIGDDPIDITTPKGASWIVGDYVFFTESTSNYLFPNILGL